MKEIRCIEMSNKSSEKTQIWYSNLARCYVRITPPPLRLPNIKSFFFVFLKYQTETFPQETFYFLFHQLFNCEISEEPTTRTRETTLPFKNKRKKKKEVSHCLPSQFSPPRFHTRATNNPADTRRQLPPSPPRNPKSRDL